MTSGRTWSTTITIAWRTTSSSRTPSVTRRWTAASSPRTSSAPPRKRSWSYTSSKRRSEGIHRARRQAAGDRCAHHSHETYVSLSATFVRRADPHFVLAFSIPTNTPGLKILCREPVSQWVGSYGHPLGMLYDEQDAMLFFDHVLVPWERVFTLYDASPYPASGIRVGSTLSAGPTCAASMSACA